LHGNSYLRESDCASNQRISDISVAPSKQCFLVDQKVYRTLVDWAMVESPTSSANTAARRVKNLKLLVNETHPTHNNRSRGAGGVSIDSVNTSIDFINDRV
jgi:hypothetical protein